MLKSNLKQLPTKQAELAALQRREGERSEPDRRGGAANSGGAAPVPLPNPEVAEKPKRRQFTAEYKRSIVSQVEACRGDGSIGAAAPAGVVFVPSHNLATPEGARRTRCLAPQEARAQIHSQPADGGKPAPAEKMPV